MTRAPAPGKATLLVQLAVGRDEHAYAALPVQVRRLSMVVAERGRTGEPIPVDAGEYVVTTRLPSGEELFQRAVVEAGETRTVELRRAATEMPARAPAAAATRARSAGQRRLRASGSPDASHSTAANQVRAAAGAAGGAARPQTHAAARTVYLRLLEGDPLRPPLRTIGAATVGFPGGSDREAVARRPLGGLPALPARGDAAADDRWLSADRCELRLWMPERSPAGQVFWLRVTAPPDRTRCVAVPALAGQSCTLLLGRPGDGGEVTADFRLADPEIDALLHYRQIGDASQARALLGEGIVARLGDSPLFRAVLGYAALRLGVEHETGYGRSLLERSTTTLPDAWLVEAEYLARGGDHEGAQLLFAQSTQHGLPMFGDGLGYLSSRIPQYLRLMAADTDPSVRELLSTTWERLRPFVGVADLKPALLTLRGDVLPYTGPR